MTEITSSQCTNGLITFENDIDVKNQPAERAFMFIYLDTETTGNGPDDQLCQIAFKPENGTAVSGLFNPGKPISIDAMAIHHITEKMVADKPSFRESDGYAELQKPVSNINNVIVSHNAKFDMQMLQMEDLYSPRVSCTLKLARYLDKNGVIPKYNLQYLRYYLVLKIEAKAHDALGDILVLEGLFSRLNTWPFGMHLTSSPVLWSGQPSVPTKQRDFP